jgi:hypothetical protein
VFYINSDGLPWVGLLLADRVRVHVLYIYGEFYLHYLHFNIIIVCKELYLP